MPNSTKDEIIERLIAENSFSNKMINDTKIELSQFKDIDGMSFIKAVKEIVIKYKDLITEKTRLKEEMKVLKKTLDKFSKS